MDTWVTDYFPLEKLECQYFDVCRWYKPGNCNYTTPCELRQDLRHDLESYTAIQNLKVQVELILDEKETD